MTKSRYVAVVPLAGGGAPPGGGGCNDGLNELNSDRGIIFSHIHKNPAGSTFEAIPRMH